MAAEVRVGTILIGMRVGIGGLKAGVTAASSVLARFSGVAGELKASTIAGAAGLGAVAFGLEKLRAAGAENIDNLANMADRIGASTENLSGLQFAAKMSNVEFDQLGTALTKMGVNLAKTAMEGQGADSAFTRLGLSAAQLATMDRVAAFTMVADAIGQIDNRAEQSALAMEIFGKAGAALGPLMQQGAAGIQAAMMEGARVQGTFSRIDAAKVEAANDSWGGLGKAVLGVGETLAIVTAPAFKAVFDVVTDGIVSVREWVAANSQGGVVVISAQRAVGTAFGVVADVIHTVKLGWMAAQAAVTSGIQFLVGGFDKFQRAVADVFNLIPGIKVEGSDFAKIFEEELGKTATKQWDDFNKALAADPPSVGITKFFDEIKAKALEASQAVAPIKSHFAEIEEEADAEKVKKEKLAKEHEAKPFGAALEAGSIEARSALLALRAGGGKDKTQEIAANTATAAQLAAQQLAATHKVAAEIKAAFGVAQIIF